MAGRGTPEQPLPEEASLEQAAGGALLEHIAEVNPVLMERLMSAMNAQLVLLLPGHSWEAKKEYWSSRVREREYLQAHATAVLAHALRAKFGVSVEMDAAITFLGTKDDEKLRTFVKRAFADVSKAYRIARTSYADLHETIGMPTRLVPMESFHLPGHADLGRERALPEAIPAAVYAARRALGTTSLIRTSTALSGLVTARSAHFGVFHELRQLQDVATGVQRLHRRLLDPLADTFPQGRSLRTRYACDPDTGDYIPYIEGFDDPKAQKLPEDLCAEIVLRLRAQSRGTVAEGSLAPLPIASLVEEARSTGAILGGDPGIRAWRDFTRGLSIVDQRNAHHVEGAVQLNAIVAWLDALEKEPPSEHSIIAPLVQMLSLRRTRAVPRGEHLFVRFLDTSDRLVLTAPTQDAPACTADFYEMTHRGYVPQWRARVIDTPEGLVSSASPHPALGAAHDLVDATLGEPSSADMEASLGDEGMEAFRHHASLGLLRLVTLLREHGRITTALDKRRLAGKLSKRFTVPELHARPLSHFNAAMAPRFAAYVPPVAPPVVPPNPALGARMLVALASGLSLSEAERSAVSTDEETALPVERDMFSMLENRQRLRDTLRSYMHGATDDDARFDAMTPEEHASLAREDQRGRYEERARAKVRALLPRNPDDVVQFIREVRFDTFLQFLQSQSDPGIAHTLERRMAEALDELSAQYLDVARRPPKKRRTRAERQDLDRDAAYEPREFIPEETLPGYGGYREFTQLATIAWALGFNRFNARIPQLAAIEPQISSLAPFFRKLRVFAKYLEDDSVPNFSADDLVQAPRILGDAFVEDLSLPLIEQILNGPNGTRLAKQLRAILTRVLPDAAATFREQCATYEARLNEASRIQSERGSFSYEEQQRKKQGLPPLPRPIFPQVDAQPPSASLRIAIGQLASVARLVKLESSVFDSTRAFDDLLAAFYPNARNPVDAYHGDVQRLDLRRRDNEMDRRIRVAATKRDEVVLQLEYMERELRITPKRVNTSKSRLEKALDEVLDVVRLPDRIRDVQYAFLVAAHVRDTAVRTEGPIDVRVLHSPARAVFKDIATRLATTDALAHTVACLADRGAFAVEEVRTFWADIIVAQATEQQKRLGEEYVGSRRGTLATTALYQTLCAIGYVDALDGGAYRSPDLALLGNALDTAAPWLAGTMRTYIAHYAQHVHMRKTWDLEIVENH